MNDLHFRLVEVEISLTLLKEMLRLPANVTVVRAVPDRGFMPRPDRLHLILQSADFSPVPEGCLAPTGVLVSESERHVTKTRVEVFK